MTRTIAHFEWVPGVDHAYLFAEGAYASLDHAVEAYRRKRYEALCDRLFPGRRMPACLIVRRST